MLQKLFLFLIVLSDVFSNFQSSEHLINKFEATRIQDILLSLSEDHIPNKFKTNSKDNSNWCCRISNPIVNIQQTRVVSNDIVNSGNHRCGYQSCGFLGWGKCTKWCLTYWTETRYYIESYDVTYQHPCPQEHLVCCPDHFLIMGHCFHLDEIQNNLEMLAILNNQGIVLPIGK